MLFLCLCNYQVYESISIFLSLSSLLYPLLLSDNENVILIESVHIIYIKPADCPSDFPYGRVVEKDSKHIRHHPLSYSAPSRTRHPYFQDSKQLDWQTRYSIQRRKAFCWQEVSLSSLLLKFSTAPMRKYGEGKKSFNLLPSIKMLFWRPLD